jgi:hypothetical protein
VFPLSPKDVLTPSAEITAAEVFYNPHSVDQRDEEDKETPPLVNVTADCPAAVTNQELLDDSAECAVLPVQCEEQRCPDEPPPAYMDVYAATGPQQQATCVQLPCKSGVNS